MKTTVAAVVLALAWVSAAPGVVFAVAPSITSFSPPSGPISSVVTINGTNLSGATAVRFNGTYATIKSNTAVQIKAVVQAGSSTGPISVTTSGGTANSSTNFIVTLGIALTTSFAQPGETIKVAGSGFSASRIVELYLDGRLRSLVLTSATGTFVGATLKIGKSTEPGVHVVSAVDRATGRGAQRQINVGTNWPMFRGGPLHRGRNSLETIISPANVGDLEQAWSSTVTGGAIFSSPAVVDGVVYVGSLDNKLYAFAAGGCASPPCAPLWSAATGDDIFSSPAVVNGVVYVGSYDNSLYAFAAGGCGAATCAPLWSAATGGDVRSSPAVANGVVYVGSNDSKLYAFAAGGCGAATCAPLWSSTATGDRIDSSPAVAKGVVYVGSNDFKLYAFAAGGCGAATCAPLWSSTATGGEIHSSPAVANGIVYVGSDDVVSGDDALYAFAAQGCGAATCAPKWTTGAAINGPIQSSPAVANGVVYLGAERLYAYSARGCGVTACAAPLWRSSNIYGVFSSPAVANGVVYVASSDGSLYAFPLCAATGNFCEPLWSSPATGGSILSSPAVVNGVVYIGSYDGKLYAFDLSGDTGVTSLPR